MKRKLSSQEQIRYGGVISYVLVAINIVLGLIYTPWILKELGSSKYGVYTLACSLIALFLMDFGMSAAVTRFLALYRAEGEPEKARGFVGTVCRLYLILMAAIGCALTVVYFNIERIYKNLTADELYDFKTVFLLVAVCVVVCFPVNIFNGILNAYEEYVALKLTDVFNKVGTVLVTVVALLHHGGLIALVVINEAFNILTFLVKMAVCLWGLGIKPDFRSSDRSDMKSALVFSGWTTLTSVSQSMIFNIMPSILAATLDTLAITLYGFANVIEGYISTITGAINGLFLPAVSREVVGEEHAANVLPLMIRVGRINQSIVSLLLIGLAVLGKEFVRLWVGDEYAQLYYCILLLALPYAISPSQQIAASSVIALNKVKYTSLINLATGVMNLATAYFLAKRVGVTGVCGTISLTYCIRLLCNNILYAKVLKIDLAKFFAECQLRMLPGILLSALLAVCIVMFFPKSIPEGWFAFGVKVVLICAVYGICMWLIGWNEFEKELARSIVKHGRHIH